MNEELILLRDEMRQGFSEMRQGFVRVDQRLDRLDLEVADLRHDVVQLQEGVAQLHQGLAMLGRRVDALDQRVQSNGVLLEALRGEVRQIAEAYVLLDQRVERYRNENEMAHREILALLHSSYRELDRRLTRLEERARDEGDSPRS
jgi:chromosome segregation ATPase